MISKPIDCIVRGTQALFAVVVVSLVGDIFANSYWNQIPRGEGNPSQINYPMFVGVWTLVCACYFFPTILRPPALNRPFLYATACLDAMNTLFYVGGAIALTVAMNIHSCSNTAYTRGNKITKGAPNKTHRCREAQALTAFLWFNFLVFAVTTVFSVREIILETTGLDAAMKKSSNRNNGGVEMMAVGEMVADSAQPTGPRRKFFPFRRRKELTKDHPSVAVADIEVGNDIEIPTEEVIMIDPETDIDHSRPID